MSYQQYATKRKAVCIKRPAAFLSLEEKEAIARGDFSIL